VDFSSRDSRMICLKFRSRPISGGRGYRPAEDYERLSQGVKPTYAIPQVASLKPPPPNQRAGQRSGWTTLTCPANHYLSTESLDRRHTSILSPGRRDCYHQNLFIDCRSATV
jgi:hypothetical protein